MSAVTLSYSEGWWLFISFNRQIWTAADRTRVSRLEGGRTYRNQTGVVPDVRYELISAHCDGIQASMLTIYGRLRDNHMTGRLRLRWDNHSLMVDRISDVGYVVRGSDLALVEARLREWL